MDYGRLPFGRPTVPPDAVNPGNTARVPPRMGMLDQALGMMPHPFPGQGLGHGGFGGWTPGSGGFSPPATPPGGQPGTMQRMGPAPLASPPPMGTAPAPMGVPMGLAPRPQMGIPNMSPAPIRPMQPFAPMPRAY